MTDNLLKAGDIAPDFTLATDIDTSVTLSQLKPAPVVLYFYPKDSTPGCTTQAIDFTSLLDEFTHLGARILGVSKDSLKRHENFRAKNELKVELLSDEQSDVCERYGVWGEKKNYGRTYMGITRTTFLIDANGKIHQVWNKVRVKDHANEVLNAVRNMVENT
jgi:peroxiredoxin Q/BCP